MIEAVIFDMDGLLIDSEPVWDRARARMAARLGQNWDKRDHQAVMGVSTSEWADYMKDKWNLTMSREEVIQEIVGRMQSFYREKIPFRQNAVASVELAVQHYRAALASGSEGSLIELVTTSPELDGKLEIILSADKVARGKPKPDVYLEAARLLGVAPENCVCVEDSQNGILAGLNAGMKVIAVPDPDFPVDEKVLAKVDAVLTSLDEFTLSRLERLA